MSDSATGSSTAAAAVPATTQGPAPAAAAPATAPVANVPLAEPKRKQKNFAPRKAIADSASAKTGGLSQMLSGVADLPYHSIKRNETTYKVPSFIVFYYVVSLMNNQMSNTKRFLDANPDWHPLVSDLYFAILVFYHVLKCQQQGATISHEQVLFLEFLEENYNVKHAKIPGPLVPFFQALAANAGPDANYGNVVFGLPNNFLVNQNRDFRFGNRLNRLLPNVIFALDQLMRIINDLAPVAPAAAAPVAVNMSMVDRVFMNTFGIAAGPNVPQRFTMANPIGMYDKQVTTQHLSGFIGASNIWRNCLPFDPATNQSTYIAGANQGLLSFAQILGFQGFGATVNSTYDWFSQVGRINQPYSDFFRDSVSLGAISTTGIGVNYIITTPSLASAAVLTADIPTRDVRYQPAGTIRYAPLRYQGVTTSHAHSEEYLDEVTEQMGMLTQLDVNWQIVNGAAGAVVLGPVRGNTTVGPLDDRLIMRQTGLVNATQTFPDIISGYYHAPAALKFE